MSLYFSGGFNVKPKTIEKYGAFNISLVSDLPLFIPSKRGMGMWKTLRVSHIPTPSAATTDKLQTRRYTNNLLGTKDRSGHEHCHKSAGRHRPGDLPLFDRIGRSATTGDLLDVNAIEEGYVPIKTPANLCCGKSSVPPQVVHLLQPSLHL